MTTLTSSTVQNLQDKLNALLAKFAEENGLVAGNTEARFNADNMNIKVSFSTKESNPDAVDPRYLRDLRARGWNHGLTAEMVGVEVTAVSRGESTKYKFLGMRASKLVMQNLEDKKLYLFNADQISPRVIAAHAKA